MRPVHALLVVIAILCPPVSNAQLLKGAPGTSTHSPYTITEETEHSQTLSDGTHISTKSQRHLYRDSYGRSRTELSPPTGIAESGNLVIHINDPVARKSYMLDTRQKIATVIIMPGPPIAPLNQTFRPPAIPPAPPPDTRPRVEREDLGTQTIEGLIATGERYTTTIPTGAQGNDRPLVSVREMWMSTELRLPVYSKNSDPRNGETITHIVSIDRSEPDPALFQVPPDYTVREPNQ